MKKTLLMGIVNVTPDSYFDGGRHNSLEVAVSHSKKLKDEGADILDIGGESTRPGASPVSEAEEIKRVIPVIEAIQNEINIPISIDTKKPAVAAKALDAGATILNDVTGFQNPAMIEIAASSGVDVCVMHMLGSPQTMQQDPYYQNGVIDHILKWAEERTTELIRYGVKENAIILDPGIGFGKTVADNLEIIHNLPKFRAIGFRVLLGLSRKTFIRKLLGKTVDEVLPASLAMDTIGILNGADIIRVHDVAEHRDVIDIIHHYRCHEYKECVVS